MFDPVQQPSGSALADAQHICLGGMSVGADQRRAAHLVLLGGRQRSMLSPLLEVEGNARGGALAAERPEPVRMRRSRLCATAEDQKRAELNVRALLHAKAELKPLFAFVSCEPLLDPIQIAEFMPNPLWNDLDSWRQPEIDWVIAGGETDRMHKGSVLRQPAGLLGKFQDELRPLRQVEKLSKVCLPNSAGTSGKSGFPNRPSTTSGGGTAKPSRISPACSGLRRSV